MKFEIGDSVKIKDNIDKAENINDCGFDEDMNNYKGQIAKITDISTNGNYRIKEAGDWYYSKIMLDRVYTAKDLTEKGACTDGLKWFKKTFPKGCTLDEGIAKAKDCSPEWVKWFYDNVEQDERLKSLYRETTRRTPFYECYPPITIRDLQRVGEDELKGENNMKPLKVKLWNEENVVLMKVLDMDESLRGKGTLHKGKISISSAVSPCFDGGTVFVWGSGEESDNDLSCYRFNTTAEALDFIDRAQKCIDAYNETLKPKYEKFDFAKHIGDFAAGKIAVNCRTEDKANQFLKALHKLGVKWKNRDRLADKNEWSEYRESTCYSILGQGVVYEAIRLESLPIVTFEG